ncbi:5-hydroxytryptamine receptor 3A isoform X2 [Larimichthys crocea]|uniref:5-hydroxytryptamine receptor 3A isoform X2 n=1 Tax=Larimichthys crocea TaxID=215358 RepID=UPI000F601135|nr:5-hydroxytryptamine receptor 3A isoform X2 [Larimichthys crocea]
MSARSILAFLALIGVSSSQTSNCSYLGLFKHLNLTEENEVLSGMRPVKNWTTSTFVQIDMMLDGILEVDEKSQAVTSHIWTQVVWENEFLTWNQSDFCGIDMLTVPATRVWNPDLFIQEDASDVGTIQKSPFVRVTSDGMMYSYFRQRLTSTCQLNLWLFPFDLQKCTITFGSMVSDANSINLGSVHNASTLTDISERYMVTRGEWYLAEIKMVACNVTKAALKTSKLTYEITIIRKPMLYVVILIVPLFFLLLLDLASFFICEAKGEKLNFKVTILLSVSVLLLILQDMLPSTEDKLPMIATYCVMTFGLVGISVLEAMLVGFLIELDGHRAKKAPNSACEEIQLEENHQKEAARAEEEVQVRPEKCYLPLDGPSGSHLLTLILEEVKAARQEAVGQEKDEGKPGHYTRMAEIIDYVFFVLYFLTVATFLTVMYIHWVHFYYDYVK